MQPAAQRDLRRCVPPTLSGHAGGDQRRRYDHIGGGQPGHVAIVLGVAFDLCGRSRLPSVIMGRTLTTSADDRPAELTVLDLFAGAGGLSTGLGRTDRFRTVQSVEMDVAAAATYSLNHPGTKVHVGPIQEWLHEHDVPEVDVVVGGPPCQGFSTLGKQDAEDVRNGLWEEYARTVVRARPRYFVVENVAAFLRSAQFSRFEQETRPGGLLADWTFQAKVVNAAEHGAAQARRRAVLIGHRRDLPFPGWPDPLSDVPPRTVRQALAGVSEVCDGTDLPERTIEFHGRTLAGEFRTSELHLDRSYTSRSKARFRTIPVGGNRFDIPDHLLSDCWRRHQSGSADVMGRLHWDRPSVTIRTEFFKPEKGRYLHPVADRAISHLEAALLQGFPLDYRWVGSKTAIARQIGNAVPIPLGEAIGRTIAAAADDS